jgi:sugar lactone lactonase YvrE
MRAVAAESRKSQLIFVVMVAGLFALLGLLGHSAPPATAAASSNYLDTFGPDGTEASEFGEPFGLAVDQETGAVYVGDRATNVLYKFDEEGNPLAYGGTSEYLTGNEITGLAIPAGQLGTAAVAVDSESHVVYVTSANHVRAFEEDGEPHEFTEGPGSGTSELPGGTSLAGVAVDVDGNIYTSDMGSEKIRIYSSSGAFITEFEPVSSPNHSSLAPAALAVAPDGTLYAADATHTLTVYALEPSSVPISAQTIYGEGNQVSHGFTPSVSVDPDTQFVYTGERCNGNGDCQFPISSHLGVYEETGSLIEFLGTEEPGALRGGVPGLGVNGQAQKVYAVVKGEDGGRSQVKVFKTLRFFEGAPTISGIAVTNLVSSSATLQAKINPNTSATTYHFEYGTTDCSVLGSACTSVPLTDEAIGSGHNPVPVSVDVSGLSPDTLYYYRVVAGNSFEVTKGPVRTFRTEVSAFGFLPMDGRVWEQVTPIDKFGGNIGNTDGVVQAAADGSGVAFPTHGSIVADPEGNRAGELSEVLAGRSAAGWGVTDLVPPHTQATGLFNFLEYKAFSPDLGLAVLEPHDPTPLSPDASSGLAPYLRTNSQPKLYRPLVTTKEEFANVPPGTLVAGEVSTGDRNRVAIGGVNESLSHVVISSVPSLVDGAAEKALYMWHDGAIEPVSVLPASGGKVVKAKVGSGLISVRHAVSSDGSRVFWTPGESINLTDNPALYLRDMEVELSTRLDVARPGASEAGAAAPVFMGASRDGGVVFFTDSQQLTADASQGGRDLYRCVISDIDPSLGCVQLEDLSASLNGPGEAVVVEEAALGMAEDGGAVYFVEDAEEDAPQLYVWQAGMGVRFVASLSPEDHPDWGQTETQKTGQASRVVATSSPNGRYLTFMSERSLTGQETADPASGEPVEQAYRYDAVTDSLACISCNPSGSTDLGSRLEEGANTNALFPDLMGVWAGRTIGATLPEAIELSRTVGLSFYHPRAVLDNGRVYFNSPSPLVPADSNGTWDVYQYEPFGVGTCGPSSRGGSIAVADGACVGLISSGTNDKPSIFFDAGESGDDVFFGTSARLSVLDSDTAVDVYDARVGGIAAVAPQHPECLGEACQPPPSPPNDPTPATVDFNGPGNVKPKAGKHCRRGQRKVRQKGKVRCVKRHHRGKRHPARRAGR